MFVLSFCLMINWYRLSVRYIIVATAGYCYSEFLIQYYELLLLRVLIQYYELLPLRIISIHLGPVRTTQ